MKKIMSFILLLILCLPIITYADSMSIICPNKIDMDTEFTCQINGNTENDIVSLSGKIVLSEGLSFVSFKKSDNWLGDGDDGYITLYAEDSVTGQFNIGLLKLKYISNNSNLITINSVFYYDTEGEKYTVPMVSKEVLLKDNNTLSSNTLINDNKINLDKIRYLNDIKIENYDIEFNENVYEYILKINKEKSLVISPIVDNDNVSYNIVGNENLKNGSIIRINVFYKDNIFNTYSIIINKSNSDNIIATRDNDDIVDLDSFNKGTLFLIIVIVLLSALNIIRFVGKKKSKKNEVRNG